MEQHVKDLNPADDSLLNRIGKATPGDFCADPVADFFVAAQVLGFPADVELNLISFVVFDDVDAALDVLDRTADGFPGRAWFQRATTVR